MNITIRPLQPGDLDEADRIFRVAFGTFLGVPDPALTFGDADYVRTRFRGDPEGAFAAVADGRLVGSNFVTRWGSFGFFGPLTVVPELWNRGVAQRLLEPTIELFERSGIHLRALFTFAQSTKHVGLYQRFGFWPRSLTIVLGRDLASPPATRATRFSTLEPADRVAALVETLAMLGEILPRLDVAREIESVAAQSLGDTVILREGSRVDGVAICHSGAGSEAGSGVCYVKFGAVRPGTGAGERFERLVDACEALGRDLGAKQIVAGVNTARHDAYRRLLARGFRAIIQGVAMVSPNDERLTRPSDYLLDDWR
jgi:GNAT superfamily N-acetyltransferase